MSNQSQEEQGFAPVMLQHGPTATFLSDGMSDGIHFVEMAKVQDRGARALLSFALEATGQIFRFAFTYS